MAEIINGDGRQTMLTTKISKIPMSIEIVDSTKGSLNTDMGFLGCCCILRYCIHTISAGSKDSEKRLDAFVLCNY